MTYSNAKVLDTKHQPVATITLESVWLDTKRCPGYVVAAQGAGFAREVLIATADKAEALRTFAQF